MYGPIKTGHTFSKMTPEDARELRIALDVISGRVRPVSLEQPIKVDYKMQAHFLFSKPSTYRWAKAMQQRLTKQRQMINEKEQQNRQRLN